MFFLFSKRKQAFPGSEFKLLHLDSGGWVKGTLHVCLSPATFPRLCRSPVYVQIRERRALVSTCDLVSAPHPLLISSVPVVIVYERTVPRVTCVLASGDAKTFFMCSPRVWPHRCVSVWGRKAWEFTSYGKVAFTFGSFFLSCFKFGA